QEIQSLDTLALTFADLVNESHRAAYGLDGSTGTDFFSEYPAVNNVAGNYDRDGDGQHDSTYLYRITGIHRLNGQEQIGLAGILRLSGPDGNLEIAYRPTDTVGDLVARINTSGAEVTARLTREGRLQLRATAADVLENPDFVIRHLEDSGEFLAGYAGILAASGEAGAFSWTRADAVLGLRTGGLDYAVAPIARPSGWMEVTEAVRRNPMRVAAGFGENGRPAEIGDGSAALAIAALRDRPVMVGSLATFDDWFADAAARIGLLGEQAERSAETQSRIVKNLSDIRSSISGVNIDEELAAMIKFQHGYSAAARFIANFDEMLDTIINRMGV
ncbi:MAG TPA: flagellar basal body rod C-terminal domain-containing protein, partial [Magnetospirillaceae bacterium]|nr:flagellar basal body rod C-terminal domain-containing protein [Magnetospirillaceae bacterium]